MNDAFDDEDLSCICCLQSIAEKAAAVGGQQNDIKWYQCPRGHLFCQLCYKDIGGAEAACSVCSAPMGDVRNRVAETMSRRYSDPKRKESSQFLEQNQTKSGALASRNKKSRANNDAQKSLNEAKTNSQACHQPRLKGSASPKIKTGKARRAAGFSENDNRLSLRTFVGASRSFFSWLLKTSPTTIFVLFVILTANFLLLHPFPRELNPLGATARHSSISKKARSSNSETIRASTQAYRECMTTLSK